MMAAVGCFDIVVTGKGSHGAFPHQGIDPIVVSAQIIGALQTIVSRSMEPIQGGVVSIGSISGGEAYNILPERVVMKGTARWFRPQVGDKIEAGMHRLVNGIAESFGANGGGAVLPPRARRRSTMRRRRRSRSAAARDGRRGGRGEGDADADDGRRGFRLHAGTPSRARI